MARPLTSLIALVALVALVIAGPIGSGGVAAAAEAGSQESRLQRQVDRLPAPKRAELETQLAAGIVAAGTDLNDPATRERLARALGVPVAEIDHAVESAKVGDGTNGAPILMLFVAVALIFAPSVFKSIGGSLFEWLAEGGIEGLEPF